MTGIYSEQVITEPEKVKEILSQRLKQLGGDELEEARDIREIAELFLSEEFNRDGSLIKWFERQQQGRKVSRKRIVWLQNEMGIQKLVAEEAPTAYKYVSKKGIPKVSLNNGRIWKEACSNNRETVVIRTKVIEQYRDPDTYKFKREEVENRDIVIEKGRIRTIADYLS